MRPAARVAASIRPLTRSATHGHVSRRLTGRGAGDGLVSGLIDAVTGRVQADVGRVGATVGRRPQSFADFVREQAAAA